MSKKYLDQNGLTYFWSKIKAYIASQGGGGGLSINAVYPVGSYYETSDLNFNPNTAWTGTTWVLETEGQVHVSGSASGTYQISGASSNQGVGVSDGGSPNAIIPYHRHSVAKVSGGITGGSHKHYPPDSSGGEAKDWMSCVKSGANINRSTVGTSGTSNKKYVYSETPVYLSTSTTSETHTHDLPAHNTAYIGQNADGSSAASANTANANMQPYIIVNRWHRTA